MNVIRTTMKAFPEKQKEVLQTLLSLIEPPEKESGCLSSGIFIDIEDRNVFNLISEWETRQQLDHYTRSFKYRVLLGTASLLSQPISCQIMSISDTEGLAAVNSIRKNMKQIFPDASDPSRNYLTGRPSGG